MNTLLTKADIEYLMTQQSKLDADIREKKDISDLEWIVHYHPRHIKALKIESAEFVNATHDTWKYWKDKEIDRDKVIDEAVDVIHFCCLLFNKGPEDSQVVHHDVLYSVMAFEETMPVLDVELLQDELLQYRRPDISLALVLLILDYYNFTTQDILDAYNRKNKVNFERLESNY